VKKTGGIGLQLNIKLFVTAKLKNPKYMHFKLFSQQFLCIFVST